MYRLLLIMLFVASIVSGQISATNVYISNGISISQTPIASAWTFDAETQTITAYDGSLGADVTVPDTISGLQVLHIGDSACENKGISTITLPEGLLTIAADAFKDNAITAATAPSTLTSLGAAAFGGNYITSWWLPDHVTVSGNVNTFGSYQGSALNSLYSQEGTIGGHFSSYQSVGGFPWIRHDISATHLAAYTIVNDTITAYDAGIGGTVAILPFTKDEVTITKIDDYAFQNKGLTGLRFPTQTYGGQFPGGGQYTHIGVSSFNSNSISIVQLPGSLASTGVNSFNDCGATMVAVSSSPAYGAATFNHNYGLTSISWLMSVPNISMLMFGGCTSLSSVLLHYGTVETPDPSGLNNYSDVITIGDSAFISSAITQITIPSTCTSVGIGAFNTQSGISKIIIPAGVSIAHDNSFNDINNTQASFKDFYDAGGQLAGTYEYSGGAWSKTY